MSCLRFLIFATSFIRELDRIGGWCGLFAMKTKLRTKQDWPPGKGTTSERREKAFGLLGCKSIVERHVKIYEIIRWFVWCLGKLYILENEQNESRPGSLEDDFLFSIGWFLGSIWIFRGVHLNCLGIFWILPRIVATIFIKTFFSFFLASTALWSSKWNGWRQTSIGAVPDEMLTARL